MLAAARIKIEIPLTIRYGGINEYTPWLRHCMLAMVQQQPALAQGSSEPRKTGRCRVVSADVARGVKGLAIKGVQFGTGAPFAPDGDPAPGGATFTATGTASSAPPPGSGIRNIRIRHSEIHGNLDAYFRLRHG
jgi:hypothetical protein